MSVSPASPEPRSACSARRSGSLLALLLLAACSSSESDRIQQQSKAAASATATGAMTIDAWLAGAVPAHYARRTLKAMQEKLAAAADEVQGLGPRSAGAQAAALIRQAGDALERARAAVEASDRAAVERSRRDLRTAASTLPSSGSQAPTPR